MNKRNVFAIIICFLSLSQPLGFIIGSDLLFWSGKASAFSPLAAPFREYGGYYENYAVRETITVTDKQGVSTVVTENDMREFLSGPHRRKIVYRVAIGQGPIMPELFYTPVIQYLFCEQFDYRSVNVTFEDKRNGIFYQPINHTCI